MNSDPLAVESLSVEPSAEPGTAPAADSSSDSAPTTPATSPPPSYVKLAMRNMVRKRGTSLWHFTLTTVGLIGVLVGLAYLTR
ncbi:MAG: DUF3285 domain-containing protein [Trichocoleus desertorum ATA4-8-CV12]|jgi:hypothetical protein|nr:DUF3285 domain-containing protein [Trichocoleus desertorum ATA4-8-CV12]